MAINSIDLSKYIINYALDNNSPISNLQLQKILYFVNGEYYKNKGEFLLDEKFYAYPLGPVNKSVYNIYKSYGASKIYSRTNELIDFKGFDKNIINTAIKKYVEMSAFALVNLSHEVGKAWNKVISKDGMYSVISNDLIMEEFKS